MWDRWKSRMSKSGVKGMVRGKAEQGVGERSKGEEQVEERS